MADRPSQSGGPDSSGSDSSGIDLARAVLAAARATSRKRSAARGAAAGATGDARPEDRRMAREPAGGEGSDGSGGRDRGSGGPSGGSPRRRGRPDDRDPLPLGRAIDRLLADRGWETPAAVGGVIGRWAEIVGADVAAHCTPESFDAGVLRVATDSTAWATQVRLLAPQFLARLNAELGHRTVTRIEVRGPAGPSWRRGGRSVRGGRGPRDTYG